MIDFWAAASTRETLQWDFWYLASAFWCHRWWGTCSGRYGRRCSPSSGCLLVNHVDANRGDILHYRMIWSTFLHRHHRNHLRLHSSGTSQGFGHSRHLRPQRRWPRHSKVSQWSSNDLRGKSPIPMTSSTTKITIYCRYCLTFVFYNKCSKCPPFAETQARGRLRHCLTALLMMRWSN